MLNVLKALLSTSFFATVIGFFLVSVITVMLYSINAHGFAWVIGEGLGLAVTAIASTAFFLRAYGYERFGDGGKPVLAESAIANS